MVPEVEWREESYYPMGWLSRPFGRKPYPDMTYGEAIDTADSVLWNMVQAPLEKEAAAHTRAKLQLLKVQFVTEHPKLPGRSQAQVHNFSSLWRGPVVSLLTWFSKHEG